MANELSLQELIEKLHILFSGDKVNPDEVQEVMESYESNPSEWKQYANFDPHRYTRNLVDTGNGKFNLILLCWSEGHGSGIHDHADAHCWMKVCDGALCENLYNWPEHVDKEHTHLPESETQIMKPHRITEFHKNDVAYINDSIGLHRIENNSHTKRAVSLHLYSPPFEMCQSFDERTGKPIKCKVTFTSKFGQRTPFTVANKEISSEIN